jgi:hypothetical protein
MLKQGKVKSPKAKSSGHSTSLHQGKAGTTFWWNEPKPKGGQVGSNPTRSETGQSPKTIGPRVA